MQTNILLQKYFILIKNEVEKKVINSTSDFQSIFYGLNSTGYIGFVDNLQTLCQWFGVKLPAGAKKRIFQKVVVT